MIVRASFRWGGRKLDALTNVVFSNGLFDPWSGGGVLKSLSDSVVSVIIPEGAHHLDVRLCPGTAGYQQRTEIPSHVH